ncbi:MAG: PAS domain S-box protein [Desulfuromonadaceae bacterium]|nr:PAS domain S-box protein [Desulfuromonadaceae bacterium]
MIPDGQLTHEKIAELEQRISELAQSKARLELLNRLLTSLSEVAGLDNMVQHILNVLMQTIGAANISIIFRVGDNWRYRDVFGASGLFQESDNPDVVTALADGKPVRISQGVLQDVSAGEADLIQVEEWIYPLVSQERKIGAICMDGMQFSDTGIFKELIPFFVYAGLMLDNEISNYSLLSEAHQRLQDSETLYRTLFDESPAGVVLWSVPDLRPLQFNTAAHAQLDYTREEFAGLTVSDFEAAKSAADMEDTSVILRRDGIVNFETIHRTKGGDIRSMAITLRMIELSGEPCVIALHRDITEMNRTRASLEENRRFLADIIEYSGMLIAVKDREGHYEIVNRKWEEVTGLSRSEAIGKTDEELFPGSSGKLFRANDLEVIEGDCCIEREEYFDDAVKGRQYGISTKFPLKAADGTISGLCLMSTDITDRKRSEEERLNLEKQLLHSQKLKSLGVLAGGIAHDFNNILTAIIGNADLALMRINKESPAVDNLHRIEHAAARAADLAKQMLAYSGKGKFVVENINLNVLLEDMLHMLEVSISKKAVLRLNPHQQLPVVEADATQIRQIVMNLVINASEAIGDKSGVIAITTGCIDCNRNYLEDVWLDENLNDGLYVYLEIADTGCGMDKETLSKLFDPFFTTKFTGRGLGMAAVLGIVRGHKGAIKVYSEQNKGTTFKILLPSSGKPPEVFNGTSPGNAWHGNGVVLLVDDEETIRGLGIQMLKEIGFSAITADDGREALEIFKSRDDIAFVILDLTMPHMDGEQCFRELRQLNPDVKVIMSSGFNEQEVTQKFIGKGLAGFLQKPYKLSTLQSTIQKVLKQ